VGQEFRGIPPDVQPYRGRPKKEARGLWRRTRLLDRELTEQGGSVISFDPIYRFTREDIERRINEVRDTVMEQMRQNLDNYIWKKIKNPDELENLRMSAMKRFPEDYEKGKAEGRYVYHELPDRLPYEDNQFDIGLNSHFLLVYTALGYDFHIKAITEMLRVCREIRIFPIVDLDANKTDLISRVIDHFGKNYRTKIVRTDYEFQKGDNKMFIINKERV